MRKREEGQRTLNVVVEGADAVAVALQQVEGRRVAEVLKLRRRTRAHADRCVRQQYMSTDKHTHRRVAKVLKLSASEASGIFCDLYRYFKTHP